MKINHVHITNWKAPGTEWWEDVAKRPDEPLIDATIQFTLSHREYHQLIDIEEGRKRSRVRECEPPVWIPAEPPTDAPSALPIDDRITAYRFNPRWIHRRLLFIMNPLLTIVPFYSRDSAQAASMLDWMADLSGQQQRTVVLAHESQVPAQEVQRAASRAFTKVEHLIVTACGDSWPLSANCYFGCIAFAMRGRAPWLLMEGDCTPTHPQTLDMIEADYVRSGRACLGAIIPAYVSKGGAWVENGKMLAGVAIYHPNLWDNSPLLRSLGATQAAYAAYNKKNPGANSSPKAFDCYLAPEILPGAGETPLIQHMGRSREFRREGGQIVCSYGPESRWSPVVAPQTVLVHGCKDGSLINLLRAEMSIPAGKREPAAPAVIIHAAAPAARPVADGFKWEDDQPVEKKPSAPVVAAPVPPRPPVASHEALATLADARLSIQHWPDCTQALFSLQEQKGRGRFRVVCQCKANSAKLPEGVDWESVWKDASEQPKTSAIIEKVSAPAAESKSPATTFEEMVAQAGGTIERVGEGHRESIGSSTAPSVKAPSETFKFIGMGSPESASAIGAAIDQWEIPIQKLRARRDIVIRFPELAKLLPGQFRRRWNQIRKKDREAKLKPATKALETKAGNILTEPARARKLELLEMCRGKQGAFLKLRRHAEGIGLTHTKQLKKDALIVAILEKEFAQPYEEFAEAGA
jgi:hypothetical protein